MEMEDSGGRTKLFDVPFVSALTEVIVEESGRRVGSEIDGARQDRARGVSPAEEGRRRRKKKARHPWVNSDTCRRY